jgi:hypothetical protein
VVAVSVAVAVAVAVDDEPVQGVVSTAALTGDLVRRLFLGSWLPSLPDLNGGAAGAFAFRFLIALAAGRIGGEAFWGSCRGREGGAGWTSTVLSPLRPDERSKGQGKPPAGTSARVEDSRKRKLSISIASPV